MRIAFTSCFSTRGTGHQAVWDHIAEKTPDALVLLGDSVYADVPGQVPVGDNDFCTHLHALYAAQLQVPGFDRLLKQVRQRLGTHAIWDDHDFLWNDAHSKEALRPQNIGRALYSSALFGCWTEALRTGAPWPVLNSAAVQSGYQPNAKPAHYHAVHSGYRHQVFSGGPHDVTVVLHLSDGRSHRTGDQVLGEAQRQAIGQTLSDWPQAVHVLASGSPLGVGKSAWSQRPADLPWLRQMASRYRLLVVSGDIHRNNAPAPQAPPDTPGAGPRWLWEATASGAAVNFNPFGKPEPGQDILGSFTEHFGLLDISQSGVKVRFFAHGVPDPDARAQGFGVPGSFIGPALGSG